MYSSRLHYFKTARFNCFLITFCFCKIMSNTENKYTGCKVSASRNQENKLGQCLILNLLNNRNFRTPREHSFRDSIAQVVRRQANVLSHMIGHIPYSGKQSRIWSDLDLDFNPSQVTYQSAISQSVCFLNCRMGTLTPKVIRMKNK